MINTKLKCAVSILPALLVMPAIAETPYYIWMHPDIESYATINGDVNYTLTGTTENPVEANIITGTAMRDHITGNVNVELDYVRQIAKVNPRESRFKETYVAGNLFLPSSGGYLSTSELGVETGDTSVQQFIDGNLNLTVSNSEIDNSVVGINFYANTSELTKSGISGKTTVTINNSNIKQSVRGTNYRDIAHNEPKAIAGDIELNINDSVIGEEVISAGSHASAENVVINVTGNTAVGYTSKDATEKTDGADGWIIAGANREGATISSTIINLIPGAGKTINIAGDVHAGSRERTSLNTDENSVKGDATLNMLKGTVNIGGDVRAYHVGGTKTMNLENVTVNVTGTVKEFDVINIDDSSVLTTAQLIMPENSVINMTLTSADKHAVLDVTDSYTGGATVNMLLTGAGTYNDVLLNYASDIDLSQSSSLFDIAKSGADIVVSVKSVEDIVADNGVSVNSAVLLSNLADAPSDVLTAVSLAAQDALADGRTDYVDQELAKLAPESNPVAHALSLSIRDQVMSLVANRTTGSMGRNGGDVYLTGGGVWAQGLFNKSKLNNVFHGYTRGVAAGIDEIIDYDVMLGVGYAYDDTNVHANSGRSTDVTSNTLFLYVQYKPNQWFINGVAHYTKSTYKENADVFGVAKTSKHDVDSAGASVTTGYRFASGAIPELGLRYLHISQDDYVDSMGMHVKSDNTDLLTSVAGVKYVFDAYLNDSWVVKPELRAAATYDIISDKSNSTIVMPGAAGYVLSGDRLSRVGGEFGLGLATTLCGVELSVGYDLTVHKDYTSQTGMLKFRYNF